MATIGLVLDCAAPEVLAAFWAAALGYTNVGAAGAYVLLLPPDPTQPKLLLQRVAEPKNAKNRMHLDIHVPDIDVEAARLESLGAHRISRDAVSEYGTRWHVMVDPEGNELCVCDGGGAILFPDLDGVSAADEQAAVDSGRIQAIGIRYVGRAKRAE